MHFSSTSILSFLLLLSGSSAVGESCFETTMNCFADADMCTSDGKCPPVTGSCNAAGNGCLDLFDEPTECVDPVTETKDTCEGGLFCGSVSETCFEDNCINRQKEQCPLSLPKGTCNEDGSSGCPVPEYVCAVNITSNGSGTRTSICRSSSGGDGSSGATTTYTVLSIMLAASGFLRMVMMN